jgi:inorganic pyrophosphatase
MAPNRPRAEVPAAAPARPGVHLPLRPLVAAHLRWDAWEHLVRTRGVTLDRPRHAPHPQYPDIIYPLDYGYVEGTLGTDGEGLDVFVGTADGTGASPATGLVGLLLTTDHRRGDREVKLLVDCTPAEVYTAHGFISYDRRLIESVLVMRQPMRALWAAVGIAP